MSITFATAKDTVSPVVVLTSIDADGDIRLTLAKDGQEIGILFIGSSSGMLHRFSLLPSQQTVLREWGFKLDGSYVVVD